ncbi:MAG: hypothetical protein SGILL_003223, partial [Bacillariaceae sp.]
MEYLSWAFENEDMQERLSRLRMNRLESARRRQVHKLPLGVTSSTSAGIEKQIDKGVDSNSSLLKSEQARSLTSKTIPQVKKDDGEVVHADRVKEKAPKRRFRLFRKMKPSRRDKGQGKSSMDKPPLKVDDDDPDSVSDDPQSCIRTSNPEGTRAISTPREDLNTIFPVPGEPTCADTPFVDAIFANWLPFVEELEAV